ncbi:hypothetical protein KI659_14675 [Litoribacter alkaliphilus]|uniref:MlpB protein n=1 Tax=Litoribacter ruber TaxID=702568 RepID=A0AAP2G581_9BACT|nr:hypothetical protein [Litoribacter alkaliphilus]MBS9525260.1 hypothetical protein [Litoribacter alkaliphilus]
MKTGSLLAASLSLLILAACSTERKRDVIVMAGSPEPEVIFTNYSGLPTSIGNQVETAPEKKEGIVSLQRDKVCMVNNAYMKELQFPVEVGEKTYYGCCEMCVNTIKKDPSVLVAEDPHTGAEVDKAKAFIVLDPTHPNDGVLYFESKENYKAYTRN